MCFYKGVWKCNSKLFFFSLEIQICHFYYIIFFFSFSIQFSCCCINFFIPSEKCHFLFLQFKKKLLVVSSVIKNYLNFWCHYPQIFLNSSFRGSNTWNQREQGSMTGCFKIWNHNLLMVSRVAAAICVYFISKVLCGNSILLS